MKITYALQLLKGWGTSRAPRSANDWRMAGLPNFWRLLILIHVLRVASVYVWQSCNLLKKTNKGSFGGPACNSINVFDITGLDVINSSKSVIRCVAPWFSHRNNFLAGIKESDVCSSGKGTLDTHGTILFRNWSELDWSTSICMFD